VVRDKEGEASLTSAEWNLPRGCIYVRAEVVAPDGKHAWTNPIVLKESDFQTAKKPTP
jgi:hypothetical protein